MKLPRKIAALAFIPAAFSVLAEKVLAQTCDPKAGVSAGVNCASGNLKTNLSGRGGIIFNLVNTLIGIVGVISVIMIIVGAFQLTLSSGNPESIKKAKNTILYSIIGVVIALSAFAIVNFVLARV